MTIEEQERAAYAAGNTALAVALGQVIDLENEAANCARRSPMPNSR
jgi:hypothetical protein